MDLTFLIHVSGKVQGVFFRQSTKEKADELGIVGTVMNQPDNTVLITATGPKEKLDQLVKWCHQGPRRANVEKVEVKEIPFQSFSNFTVSRK